MADDFTQKQPERATGGYLAAIDSFLNISDFNLTLSYSLIPDQPPIVLPVRVLMNDDEIAMRQKFYAQPEGDRTEAKMFSYQVDLLCSILSGPPTGLKHFDEFAADTPATTPVGDILKAYLNRGGSFATMLVRDAIEQYYNRTKPAEFFR